MSAALTVQVSHEGRTSKLFDVACTLGPRDKPYPERHGHWTIALVRRGTFNYRAADTNKVHTLHAGWLLLGRPEREYECSHDETCGDDCVSLEVSHDVIADVASATKGCSAATVNVPVMAPVARASALFERTRLRRDEDIDEIGYLVAEAVVAEAARAPRGEVAPHPSHRGRIDDAIRAIEASCDQPLSLAELAARAGLSPFHFLRVFRRVTGTTPHQYLIGARLRRAARLLLDTSRPVTEIAYDAGFEDLSNFVRTFHRTIGCTPRAYRRR